MPNKKPKVKKENKFSYTNKLTKKSVKFTPVEDEVVVTFQPGSTSETARSAMEKSAMSITEGMNMQRGFAVFSDAAVPKEKSRKDHLTDETNVANALPVMVDQEGLRRFFLPDEFTVQFKETITKKEAETLIKKMGTKILVEQRTPGYYTLEVPEGEGLFENIQKFGEQEEVAFAEPSEAGFNDALQYLPDDTDFPVLWAMRNTGQVVNNIAGTLDADIDATEAWDINRGKPEIVIAVIDTGCDMDHPDLKNNLLPRGTEDWDFADAGDPSPDDSDIHGTHVAGTAAAIDNTVGVIGVAPKCRIMPLRVNLTAGMNQNRADAINFVAAHATANPGRRYVINCSWKMSGDHTGVRNAIINAVSKNVVVCFAAGNANTDIDVTPQYPAVYPEVIAVAATNQKDVRASFSNYGTKVDVSAPGVNIYSSIPDNTYTYLDGTSMASPHVAGLAALIWSRNKTLTNAQVRNIIQSTCDNIDAKNPGFAGRLGRGRINAYHALMNTPAPVLPFTVIRRFRFPQLNSGSSSALTYVRRMRIGFIIQPALLFLTQKPFSERIYFMNPGTGAVMGSIDPVSNDTIGSLEWDGSHIRVANVTTGSGFINTINPSTGAQLASMPVPAGRGEGLAFDGTYFYYSIINRIYVIKPTGAVVRSFPAPGGSCHALAYGDGLLFSGNSTNGVITVFHPGTLIVHGTINAPGAGANKVQGLAYNAATNELFVANQGENIIYVGRVTL
ncbi:MAG: S8 family serine peptidase [Chitinophagaceae bacterium]|nr:S8 family serine peptidase [Chitinophagaceae bacterium]